MINIHIQAWVGSLDHQLLLLRLVADTGMVLSIGGGAQDKTGFRFQVRMELFGELKRILWIFGSSPVSDVTCRLSK